jgi:hypothetical protein
MAGYKQQNDLTGDDIIAAEGNGQNSHAELHTEEREMERWKVYSQILSVSDPANQLGVVRGLLLVDAGKAGGMGNTLIWYFAQCGAQLLACKRVPILRPIGSLLLRLVVL